MEGITKSGFKYTIDENIAEDYEFVELLCDIADEHFERFPKLADMLLGKAQTTALKAHLKDLNGRVTTKAMVSEIFEIIGCSKELKNC